jgi:hypothetical protein
MTPITLLAKVMIAIQALMLLTVALTRATAGATIVPKDMYTDTMRRNFIVRIGYVTRAIEILAASKGLHATS